MSTSTSASPGSWFPFIAIPCPAQSMGGFTFLHSAPLAEIRCVGNLQSGELQGLQSREVHRRDTKSQSLEYMGREEGTVH
jgi:hypothetical protein